jgi:hypothetical protein
MTHSNQEITTKLAQLTEPMKQGMHYFIEFIHAKVARQALPCKHEPALLSVQALAVDWKLA